MPLQNVAFIVELTNLAFWLDWLRFWIHLAYLVDLFVAITIAMIDFEFAPLTNDAGSAAASSWVFVADIIGRMTHFVIWSWNSITLVARGREAHRVRPFQICSSWEITLTVMAVIGLAGERAWSGAV